jgi:hypothetical protein
MAANKSTRNGDAMDALKTNERGEILNLSEPKQAMT